MEKEKVIEFFNAKAENWDQRNESNDEIIKIILDSTGLRRCSPGCGVWNGSYDPLLP